MTDKAYIVANEQQERKVLEKLEQEGLTWNYSMKKVTQVKPNYYPNTVTFPYSLGVFNSYVFLDRVDEVEDEKIVYDGRKEEQMSDKYVVSQEFMNELEDWKLNTVAGVFINDDDIEDLPYIIVSWWKDDTHALEKNNRLIAIIRWVNGEDVFEVEKPKKWVVRSKELSTNGEYHYGVLAHFGDLAEMNYFAYDAYNATKFDTKEEAESWANAHQEVVEVDE